MNGLMYCLTFMITCSFQYIKIIKPHKQLIFPNSHEYINIHRFYYVIN